MRLALGILFEKPRRLHMGVWGPGNLESDGAQDVLADFCEDLFTKVIELLRHPRVHEYDDGPIYELFVNLEVIFALQERDMIAVSPPIEELEPLLSNFLTKWEEYSGLCPERRDIILKFFRRLTDIVSGSASDGLSHRLHLISDKLGKPKVRDPISQNKTVTDEQKKSAEKAIEDILGLD